MLHIFRKSQRPLLWIILVLVIFAFVGLWGTDIGVLPQRRPDFLVGRIGRTDITRDTLARAVRGVIINESLRGRNIRDLRRSNLEHDALQRMALLAEAHNQGVVVSDEELRNFIQQNFFGQQPFSPEAYRAIIRQSFGNITEREFEEHIRNTLVLEKLQQYINTGIVISEEDVLQRYRAKNALMQFAYVSFPLENYLESVEVFSNEVEDVFYQNEDMFLVPTKVQLAYAHVLPDTDDVIIDEEDLYFWYENRMDDYLVTNIVIEANVTNFVVDTAAFDDVADTIRTKLTQRHAVERALDRAEHLFLYTGMQDERYDETHLHTFTNHAQSMGMRTVITDWLAEGDYLTGMPDTFTLVNAALEREPGTVLDPYEKEDGSFVVVTVIDSIPAHIPTLEEAWDEVFMRVKEQKAYDMALREAEFYQSLIDEKDTDDFAAAATELGFTVKTTDPLARTDTFENGRVPRQIVSRLFAFPVGSTTIAPYADGVMIVSPQRLYPADEALVHLYDEEIRQNIWITSFNTLMSAFANKAFRDVHIDEAAFNRLMGESQFDD